MKTRMDLYNMAIRAWKEGWWYIRGGYINIGTDRFVNGKIEQYTYNATYERHIRNYIEVTRRMGKTPMFSDCYGLVKGTAWYDSAKGEATYQKDGLKDRNQQGAFLAAQNANGKTPTQNRGVTWGTIDTLPNILGLVLWKNGHAGVYIGGGYFIDTYSATAPVRKKRISEYNWTHWFKDTYIDYSDVPLGGDDIMIQYGDGFDGGSEAVYDLQTIYKGMGYDIGNFVNMKNSSIRDGRDGQYGNVCVAITRDLRRKYNLPAADYVDALLYGRIALAIKDTGGPTVEEMAELQKQLQQEKEKVTSLTTTVSQVTKERNDKQGELVKYAKHVKGVLELGNKY